MSEDVKGTGQLRIVLDVSPVRSGDGLYRARCPELDVEVSDSEEGVALLSLARAVVHRVELEAARAARDESPLTEVLCCMLDEARLRETSPAILRDLLGRHTIDGFVCVEIGEELDDERLYRKLDEFSLLGGDEGGDSTVSRDEDDDPDEGSMLDDDVFLVRVDGSWYALWASTSVVRPAIYCAQEGGPTWHLVPAFEDCSAICAEATSMFPALICDLSSPRGAAPPVGQEEGRVTCVVDAETGEVLLELGIEWYEYQSRPIMPLALSAPFERILPGESVVVVGREVEGTFDVRRLVIGNDADHWVVEDVLVGERSQLGVGHGDLPGAVFSPTASVGLYIEAIDPARPLSVRARYVGPAPEGGEFSCAAILEGPEVTCLAQRVVVGGSWGQDS